MMNASDIAAWWGAGVATVVFIWDIYKWTKEGPDIEVSASPNMEIFEGLFKRSLSSGNQTFVVVEARNNGDRKTTITHLVGYHYASEFKRRLRRGPIDMFFAPNPQPGQLPHLLDAGERWVGMIKQTEKIENMSRNGSLCVGICHSGSGKPVLARVVIHKKPGATQPLAETPSGSEEDRRSLF